jgi:hypothetical protein
VAALHFEFVVDSEVYPELHAALAAIGSHESRGERIRQLAATGLLWEAVRQHGASMSAISGPSNAPHLELPLASKSGVRTRTRSAMRPADRRSPTTPNSGDWVDPAATVSSSGPSAHAHDRRRDGTATPHIPVLLDVVHSAVPSAPPSTPAAPAQRALPAAAAVRPFVQAVEALPLQSATPAFAGDVDDAPDEPMDQAGALAPAATLMHKPVARSRLLRMKEMGLFKNG